MEQKKITDEEALKKFLLDIKSLERITSQSSFNPFDVLKIARTEIRHSNMLAWLLDPNESHGLGPRIVSALMEFVIQRNIVNTDTAFKLLLQNKDDVVVKREWKNIDILIESIKGRFVVCIENKVDTQDHNEQLNRYYKIINTEEKYRNFTKVYLYLTPDGLLPNEDENDAWEIMRYADVIEIIERELEKANLNQDTRTFINYYVEVLRRETMEDTSLAEICRQIYAEHKQALDLIFEYRPDMLQNVREIFDKWCKDKEKAQEIDYDAHKSNKSYYRFRTKVMDAMLPKSEKSDWNTKNSYYYEIGAYMDKENVKYDIHFVVNSTGLHEEEKLFLKEFCAKLKSTKKPKENWKFITPVSSKEKYIITPDDFNNEDYEAVIMANLDAAWDEVRKAVEGK